MKRIVVLVSTNTDRVVKAARIPAPSVVNKLLAALFVLFVADLACLVASKS